MAQVLSRSGCTESAIKPDRYTGMVRPSKPACSFCQIPDKVPDNNKSGTPPPRSHAGGTAGQGQRGQVDVLRGGHREHRTDGQLSVHDHIPQRGRGIYSHQVPLHALWHQTHTRVVQGRHPPHTNKTHRRGGSGPRSPPGQGPRQPLSGRRAAGRRPHTRGGRGRQHRHTGPARPPRAPTTLPKTSHSSRRSSTCGSWT